MPLRKDSKVEEKGPKIAISGVSTDKIKGDTQTDENSTAVKTAQTESLVKNEVVQSLRAPIAFPERQTCSFTDVLKSKDGGISNFHLRKSEGDILGTELMESTRHHEHESSLKEWTDQQPHIYINEEEFDETDENVKSSINQTESEVEKALETLQTESEVASEAFQSKSCSKSSVGSTISPVRRVSSLTDLLRWNKGRKSSLRRSKSEAGNVSSSEALVKDRTVQQLLNISENEEELQSDKTVGKYSPIINQTEPEVTRAGDKTDQCRSVFVLRSLPNERRRRSLSDSTTLNSPRISTAEYLRETRSYTTFPHIDTQSAPRDDKLSSFVHRTSCFRIMPHLSGDCLVDENFPTISVLSLSSLFEDYTQNIECEISSESEEELGADVEGLVHSWRKPSSRPRSYSEPVSMAPEFPVRTWSLPDMKEKRLLRFQETMYKVKASPSRLRFREQGLEKLKEEASFLSGRLSFESVKSCSSSVMSLVDNYDNEVIDQWLSSQERLGGDEVMGRWRNRPRKNSITKQPSFSMVEEAKEERQSAVSLVNQVTEQVLSSCDVDISSESNDDQLTTVEAAVKLWKEKDAGRRVTLASISPLTDSPKYASEIEQQAFRKIKKWKDSFALKLNNVLGERFQEMAAKRDEELARKKKPKVLNVPMNLSDKEMGQLKSNLLLELKKKSVGSNDHEDLAHIPPLPALPIPRVKFPRRGSSEQTPADLRAQMMKELSRRVSVAGDDEDALHCYKPSSLVPGLSKTLLQTNRQGVVYIPSGIRSTTLDPDTIRDLLSWHEAERERLKAELEGLPQAQSGEKQVLIDRNDANKVLQSMMKIMEEIFTGTIMRLMGLGEQGSNIEPTGNEETKQTEVCQIKEDDIDEPDSEAVKPGKDLKLDTDARNLSASCSTENLCSQSTAELLSSASSLTGISFSSSNDAFGICDQLKDGRASAAMKDKAADMSTNSSNVECRSASLEDAPECATSSVSPRIKECNSVPSSHILPSVAKAEALDNNQLARVESIELLLEDNQGNLIKGMLVTDMEVPRKQFLKSLKAPEETGCYCNTMINCLDAKEPRKSIKQNSGTIGKNDENHIRKLQAALQEETESENLLKQRLLSLENELNSAVNNSNYWFSQCVKKREKIEELVSNARDMNSANFELRQEIDIKSRTIYEKDKEIQRLTESKTETEILLQEVKENLFKSNEEIERLKLFIGKLNEEELRSVQTSQFLQVEALKPTTLYEKAWESHISRNNYEKENFNATHKGAESDKLSCCNDEVLSSEVQNSKYHFGPISSYNVVTRPPNTCNASVCGNNVISQSRDEHGRKEMFGAPLSNEPCSLLDNPILNDPEKTKTAIGEWLSKVIRQAKAKLSRERKSVNFSEKTYTDGSLKRVTNEKENARSPLREVVSSFKEKISKDVPGLPKKRKKNVPTHSTGPITGEHNRQKTHSVLKGCYEWSRNDTKVDNSPFALMPMDKRDDSLLNLAADVSTDTFDSMEPFADVFPANFEATDVLLAHGIDSVEPFCEVLIPWQNSKDAGVKKTIEAFKRSIAKAKQHPGKKAHLGKFLLAHGAESITLEEKKGTAQTAVPPAGSEELVFRNINDCSLKRVHPERQPKHVTEENTANIDKTSVIKMRQEKLILDKKIEPSIYNRQKENRTPKQNMLANYVQSSSATQPRTFFNSVDGTQRDYSLGLVTGKNLFSNESSTVERDVERLIAELDSKRKNYTKFQKKQQSSPEKGLQLKLNDSKLVPSSGSKITLSNNNGFIDAITIDIKLNKGQLMNEFVHGAMMNPQQPQEKITTLKAGKETHFTTNEHYMPDRLKNVALQRLNQQRKERSVPFLCEKQDISSDVCKQTNSFGTEFTQQRRIDTQRWISDMLKGVGSLETTSELTDKDQGKVRDKSEVKHQNRESNSLASIRNRVLHGASRKPESPLMCKQNISKPKAWQTPKITLGQSAKNEIFKETECSKRNASCGSNRGQQRRAESDVRIAMWQAKSGCLGGMLKERNIQDGLVDKFSERPKLAKPWTEASQLAKQTRQVEKVYKDPHLLRDFKKEEKDLHFLDEMHRSAQDVLSKQAELEKAIQKYKSKVHFMTEEMEILQRKTT